MHGIRFRAPFGKAEELALFKDYKARAKRRSVKGWSPDDESSFRAIENRLFGAYLPLVEAVSKRVYAANRFYLIDVDELISAGYKGLLDAFREFDPHRGYRFATYAPWWILQEVTKAVRAERWIVGISDYRYRQVKDVVRATHYLEQCLGRRPTVLELANHLRQPLGRVTSLFGWMGRQTISIDAPVGEGPSRFGDFIRDNNADPPIVALENSNTLQWIMGFVEALPERERTVLQYRFGLLGVQASTVEEVATRLGVTSKGVRYIQSRALEKLRSQMLRASRRRRREKLGQMISEAAAWWLIPTYTSREAARRGHLDQISEGAA